MTLPPAPQEPDEPLARALSALGNPLRIAILRQLLAPRSARDIVVSSPRPDAGGTLSRQSVGEHLDRLAEAGFVLPWEERRSAGAAREFVLNHQAFYALSEAVRGLARMRPVVEFSAQTAVGPRPAPRAATGPRFVLVKGLEEGLLFPLASEGEGSWIIGRKRGVEIALDFDPYVSAENSLVRRHQGRHVIRDLAESRNGTWVNLAPLEKGEERPLEHGDLVSVGRSALLYWTR